jgi:GT2 family glycosyltransferase
MLQAGTLGLRDAAVIVPVYGQQHLTEAVLADLRRQDCPHAVYVVDNGGDYQPAGEEFVVRPGRNLRWAGGCNLGLLVAQDQGHCAYILLNNDVRLSPGFLSGLLDAWRRTGAGLLGPVYDRNWPQQRVAFTGPAAHYHPRPAERQVPFVDGTCLLIPHATLRRAGLIDEATWPRHGWGCDKDYALRVRWTGGRVQVTERAYLNHLGRRTAAAQPGYDEADAEAENDAGMAAKWGPAWREILYAGFPDTPRDGLVQQRLANARPGTAHDCPHPAPTTRP